MNRLKGLKLKFDVTDNLELRMDLFKRLVKLGADDEHSSRSNCWTVISVNDGKINCWIKESTDTMKYTLSTLDDLYHLPKTHTITIAGKDIELSAESFAELKAQLT